MASAKDETVDVLLDRAIPGDELERREALAEVEAALFRRPREAIRFGRYVLLAERGSGGGGVVYAAYDPELDRRVAVKLVHARGREGRHDSQARQRLLREAQAAAKLSHPNVVAVYDVGTYEEGRSPVAGSGSGIYVVMELVEGKSLRELLADPRPRWREVLIAMIGVGRGLAAAHAEGLVHRDVKPGNIIVGQDGRARILDFGLARALDPISDSGARSGVEQEGDDERPRSTLEDSLTDPGTVMGTPQYMAPEQHRGDAVDARTDQFCFCATLYEALYRQRAFEGANVRELGRAKHEGRVRAVPPRHDVPRFVHAVVMRGLRPAPADRFGSMDELLRALERDPATRVRRAFVGLGIAASLAIAVGAWFGGQSTRANPCEDAGAELAGIWDEPTQTGVEAAFRATGSAYAANVWTVVDTELDDYTARWVALRTEACEQTLVDGRRDMLDVGRVMSCLERRMMRLGGLTGVLAVADAETLERAPQMVAALPALEPCTQSPARPGPRGESGTRREEVVALERDLARADALIGAAKIESAYTLVQRVLDEALALDDERLQAHALYRLGEIHQRRSRYADGEQALRQALHHAERVRDEELAVDVMLRLALGYGAFESRPDEALALARHAQSRLLGLGRDDAREAQAAHVIGRALETKGAHEEALEAQRTALDIYERIRGPDDLLAMQALNNIGVLYDRMGQPEPAHRHYSRALAVRRERLGDAHPSVANSLGNVGAALIQMGRFSEAETDLRAAVEVFRDTGDKRLWAWYADELGIAVRLLGRFDEALALHRQSLALRREVFGEGHQECGRSLVNVAATLVALGRIDEAREEARRAVALLAGLPDAAILADALTQEGAALRRAGAHTDAVGKLDEALALFRRTRGEGHPIVVPALIERGLCDLDAGAPAKARVWIERALAIHERARSADAVRAPTWLALARALESDDPQRARELVRAAVAALAGAEDNADRRAAERWLEEHA